MISTLRRLGSLIDAANERIGRAVAWLVLLLVLVIVYDVAMRYLFQIGSVALQELEWHFFSIIFLFGAAYTFRHDGHVRVDMVYRSRFLSDKHRVWIDLLGTLVFLIPFCALIIYSSWPFVFSAYVIAEGSPDPGGLPFRFLLKSAIPLAFLLLLLQGLANAVRSLCALSESASQPTSSRKKRDKQSAEEVS